MSFSSPGFLFAFLPVTLVLLVLMPHAARNAFLLLASLLFYTIDGGGFTVILALSIAGNHLVAHRIHRLPEGRARRLALLLGVAGNLAPLVYYKYWEFLTGIPQPLLPAGISFYTFQGISYLVDVHRRAVAPTPRMRDFGMYHALFPQLIAGPIVRYAEVAPAIRHRPLEAAELEAGVVRFCVGLAKKILLADTLGAVADGVFAAPPGTLSAAAAWTGALCYALQILFDFSGYSDMAIGLGRMLGFRFPENFDAPYRARSVTEFWRRWHMTLSRWFRDYVYVPLGGNRAGPWRTCRNLLAVFLLCGLWHGAAWTFVAWGLFHGALLAIERLARQLAPGLALPAALAWPLTLLLVCVGWVLFRSPDLAHAGSFLAAMAGLGTGEFQSRALLGPDEALAFAVGAALALLPTRLPALEIGALRRPARAAVRGGALGLLALSAIVVAANGFNPFIYFRF